MTRFRNIVGPCECYLTREEELVLIERWQTAGDEEARLTLFRSVFPIMLKTVNVFCRRLNRSDVEEFEAAAACGVLRAIDRFDPDRGCRLSTYAMRAAWSFMDREVSERVIRLPQNFRGQAKYRDEIERALSVGGLPEYFQEESLTFVDRPAGDDFAEPLANAIACLGERERIVIVGVFFDRRTLTDIGLEIGVTKERVRQIKEIALARLRKMLEPMAA